MELGILSGMNEKACCTLCLRSILNKSLFPPHPLAKIGRDILSGDKIVYYITSAWRKTIVTTLFYMTSYNSFTPSP